MIQDETMQPLHDRVTRGEALTPEEQSQLDAWYATQDRTEMEALGFAAQPKSLDALRTQVDSALAQLTVVSQRLKEIAGENESLRREINTLRRQLAHQSLPA